jgi:hypothetical protein
MDQGHGVFFNFYAMLHDEQNPALITDLVHLYPRVREKFLQPHAHGYVKEKTLNSTADQ